MKTTNEIGCLTVAKVLAGLLECGRHVLLPFGNVGRYDMVIDNRDGSFSRVECKTGRLRNGTVLFKTESTGGYNYTGQAKAYGDDADLFGVWCPETGKVYLMPVAVAGKGSCSLRVTDPKWPSNGSKIRWARDFEVNEGSSSSR